MSYPPPPGLKGSKSVVSSSTPQLHSSLPPRPPPAVGSLPSFKPAFTPTPAFLAGAPGTKTYENHAKNENEGVQTSSNFNGFTGFQPRAVAAHSQPFRTHSPVVSAGPAPPSNFSAPQTTYSNDALQSQSSYHQAHASTHIPNQDHPLAEPASVQIRNPFAPGSTFPGVGRGLRGQEADADMEAQIAQWQSAYAAKDDNSNRGTGRTIAKTNGVSSDGPGTAANSAPLGVRPDVAGPTMSNMAMSSAANADPGVASVVTDADGKQKTVVRSGGGKTWQDNSLLEWNPAHFRLFVGNLAGEVTDDSLLKAFSKFPSVSKARVVRDKRTTKSKGYGFVSFSDGDEYFRAARDMAGKYIGSHPVLVKKSTTEIKATVQPQQKGKGGRGGRAGNHGRSGSTVEQNGVKKQSKTKGGLKVLG
ncbi:MAG: hypothetical protein Q9167_000324 [Letrouitia subvulpina]